LLARSHALAPNRYGESSLPALQETLEGREAEFMQSIETAAAVRSAATIEDLRLFRILLQEEGPLLGYPGVSP
jgi:hypothetical protein